MAKRCWSVALLSLLALTLAAVPPHPLMKNWDEWVEMDDAGPSTHFGGDYRATREGRELPQTVLAIMVEFADVSFDTTPDYPDSVAHDAAYFDRCMLHLNDYCYDASHGAYTFEWDVYDRVTLSGEMAWYGDDNARENLINMLVEVVEAMDDEVDFSEWDALVLFHAGAGQESDIDDIREDEIWSTFINLYDLWETLDPEADSFDGIPTNDGTFVTEMSILPESEFQPYFDSEDPILGLLGVLAHEFGHQLGLPTLYDNVSSNGASQGIGNWGLMGTGAWNALGYVPPMPCAWSRVYLGWETPVTLNGDVQDVSLSFNLDSLDVNRVAKVLISEDEYFLLENRQQNPDNSTVTWYKDDGTVDVTEESFTFPIVENQEYYPEPNQHIPRFDFMTNRYRGAEWDFYLPGLGGPAVGNQIVDGSGMLIWHIDEQVIAENFTDDFEFNMVNAVAEHKGVDLEEADGVQHMDSSYPSSLRYGGPDDSFRSGNNNYFGFDRNPVTGLRSLPTAASYYGGVILEIYDISANGNEMSFSTRYIWKLDAHFYTINTQPASVADFDLDGEEELLYMMTTGKPVFWYDENSYEWPDGPPLVSTFDWPWSWDSEYGRFLEPCNAGDLCYLFAFDSNDDSMAMYAGRVWGGPIVVLPEPFQTNGDLVRYLLPLRSRNGDEPDIIVGQDADFSQRFAINTPHPLASNLMADETGFGCVLRAADEMALYRYDFATQTDTISYIEGSSRDTVLYAVQGDIDPTTAGVEIAWITNDLRVWMVSNDGVMLEGFPAQLEQTSASFPVLSDADGNGTLDIIVGGENRFSVVGYNGEILNAVMPSLSMPDTTMVAGSILALDIDNDGLNEFAGGFSRNRFCIWDDAKSNYAMVSGYPITLPSRSRLTPLAITDSLEYLYIPSDYGKIYRTRLDDQPTLTDWSVTMGDMGRTAAWRTDLPQSDMPQGSNIFYPGEVYLFPNPLNAIFGTDLTFHIRTRRTTEVSLKVYDIAANCVYQTKVDCDADMPNREKINLDTSRLSSGVYFAIIEAEGEVKRLPFAIEK